MKKPIICFDLDGTLLDKEGMMHPKDREILGAKDDIDAVFLPCTGRPRESVLTTFHHNGLYLGKEAPFAMVTQNGAAAHLSNGQLANYTQFPDEVQEALFKIFWGYPETSFMMMKEDGNYLLWPNEFGSKWMARFQSPWKAFTEKELHCKFGKMTCLTDDETIIHELIEVLSDLPVEFGRSMKSVFDIQPKGVSKRTGVDQLIHHMNLEGNPVLTAGDGDNDLDLFEFSDYSFAPTTTNENIRKQADQVINIKENGLLAAMLEKAQQF